MEISGFGLAQFHGDASSVLHNETADGPEGVFFCEYTVDPAVCDVSASFPGDIVEVYALFHFGRLEVGWEEQSMPKHG